MKTKHIGAGRTAPMCCLLFLLIIYYSAKAFPVDFGQLNQTGNRNTFLQFDPILKSHYRIAYTHWQSSCSNHNTIIYNHGLQSTKEWFNETAEALAQLCFSVYAFDRIGSGDSSPGVTFIHKRKKPSYRRETTIVQQQQSMGHIRSWRLFIDTLDQMIGIAEKDNPKNNIIVWGNSYGAKIVTAYLFAHIGVHRIDKVIFTTPGLYRNTSKMPLPFSRLELIFANNIDLFPVPMIQRHNNNGAHWFAANRRYVDLIKNDPKATRKVTRQFYLETFWLDRFIEKKRQEHQPFLKSLSRFYLLVRGDVLMDNVKMMAFIKQYPHFTVAKYYSGGTHNKHFLTFTSDREQVINDIIGFIENQPLLATEDLTNHGSNNGGDL